MSLGSDTLRRPFYARGLRHRLLASASVAAVAAMSSAQAGQPQLFSSGWFSQKGAQTTGTSVGGTASAPTGYGDTLTPQQSEQRAAQAMQALSRAAQELASATAAQRLAQQKALAAASQVPNGLVTGGLVPQAEKSWTGAKLVGQTKESNGTTQVTIDQTKSSALINWSSFNIGAKTTLYIDQAGGAGTNGNDWVAINRVLGNSTAPSQILGSIKAQGNVYVIDQNGVIFGSHSQVNVQSLVASTLGASPLLIDGNIIKPSSGTGGSAPDPAFSILYNTVPSSKSGDITVDAGAEIDAASGGRVFLFGENVTNDGAINAPAGQIALAASSESVFVLANTDQSDTSLRGLLVYADLLPGKGNTYVPATVTNESDGILTATTGNVMMVGSTVSQLGIARTTTSVDYNGSVDLLAQFNELIAFDENGQPQPTAPASNIPTTGTVILGRRSLTEATDEDSDETAPESQAFVPSSISMIGDLVDMEGNATVYTPGGQVRVQATKSIANNDLGGTASGAGTPGLSGSTGDGSRVYIDDGVVIDTAGLENVADTVVSQIVAVQLRAYELRDSPLLRQGAKYGQLYGETIYIDTRLMGLLANGNSFVGTTLADATSYVEQGLTNNVAQLTVTGGEVSLISGQDVVMRKGSLIDASGGWYNFTGGEIDPTRLLGADGHIYSIGSASPDIEYSGLCCSYQVAHPQWNTTQTYTNTLLSQPYYSPGYTQGEGAGNIYITAPSMVLQGSVLGTTVNGGPYQRSAADRTPDSAGYETETDVAGVAYWVAEPASTTTSVANTAYSNNTIAIGEPTQGVVDPENLALSDLGTNVPIELVVKQTDLPSSFTDTTPLPASVKTIDVPDSWVDEGDFRNLYLTSNADVTVDKNVALDLGPGGSLTIRSGEKVTVGGSILAPGGAIAITASDNTTLTGSLAPDKIDDAVVITKGAVIDLNGLWVDDETDPGLQVSVVQPNGGSLTIDSGKGLNVESGAVIEADGGGWLNSSNKLTAGNGGDITLAGNQDFNAAESGDGTLYAVELNGSLTAYGAAEENGVVGGYPVGNGGTLSFEVPQLTVQEHGKPVWGTTLKDLVVGGQKDPFEGPQDVLPASFFSAGGFTDFVITATAGLTVDAHTVIAPRASDLVLTGAADTLPLHPSAQSVLGFATVERLPDTTRLPVDLTLKTNFATLTAPQADAPKQGEIPGADLVIEKGALISGDPGASITLSADHQLTDYGSILAPGGAITIDGAALTGGSAPGFLKNDFDTTESVWIAAGAVLSAAGTTVSYIDPVTGLAEGQVYGGGSVSITAPGGFINVQKGATIDVSGTSGTIETVQDTGTSLQQAIDTATLIPSNGGAISLSSTSGVFLDGTIVGKGGGPNAAGGTLSVTLTDRFDGTNGNYSYAYPNSNRKIIVIQSGYSPVAGSSLKPGEALDDTTTYGFDNSLQYLQILETFGPLYGKAYVSADKVMSGGFASLDLAVVQTAGPTAGKYANYSAITDPSGYKTTNYNDSILFDGSVSLRLPESITLSAENIGSLSDGKDPASVTVSAPYVAFAAQTGSNIWGTSEPAGGQVDVGGLIDGNAKLQVTADLIDISGVNSIDRFGQIQLDSTGDIRLIGGDDLAGQGILTTGALTLDAAQVYTTTSANIGQAANNPSVTGSTFLISDTSIHIASNSADAVAPYSAGGNLTVDAPNIDQDGVLRVPQGSLTLGCFTDCADYLPKTSMLTLGADSDTTVSLDGISVPYGTVSNGLIWTAPDGNTLDAPPAKVLALYGAKIDIAKGATVDDSGGGALAAYEFTPGVGGSADVLAATNSAGISTVFAILPGYRGGYAPVDPSQTPTDGLTVGEQVYLSGGDGLTAGYYTLLPAHYALLPGAYEISISAKSTGFLPQQNYVETTGAEMMSGYLSVANTDFRQAQPEAFLVTPGAIVQTESQFTQYSASTFFPSFAALQKVATPELPIDAGTLILAPAESLSIAGTFDFSGAAGGAGGFVSLQASTSTGTSGNIAVTGEGVTAPQGYVDVSASQLSTLDSSTLLIGGTVLAPNTAANSSELPVYEATANNVLIDTGASTLKAADIILLAQDTVTVDPDSKIVAVANGEVPTAGQAALESQTAANAPAFLEISSGAERVLTGATGSASVGGTIDIGAGASITASDSVQLFARKMQIASTASIDADETEVTASLINIGTVPQKTSGLDLSAQTLATLERSKDLVLHSLSTIDFYGNVQIGSIASNGSFALAALTLDSAGLFGMSGSEGKLTIDAESLTLTDTDSTAAAKAPTGSGTVTFDADNVSIGGPTSTATGTEIAGYGKVTIDAVDEIQLRGEGKLAVVGDLTLGASSIVALNQSTSTDSSAVETSVTTPVDESISASGTLDIERTGKQATPAGIADGASLALTAHAIVDDGVIDLPAGELTLDATAGGITFGANSETLLTGAAKSFYDVTQYTSAGAITATATGAIVVDKGGLIDLDAAHGGGDAGSLTVTSSRGGFTLDGTLEADAGAGGTGGDFSVEAADLADLTKLVGQLAKDGFDDDLSLRATAGNINVTGTIAAHHLTLDADAGAIDIDGTLNAASAEDGEIDLFASGGITLGTKARLIATSSDTVGTPGSIVIDTKAGTIDAGSGASIDLAGGGYVVGASSGGKEDVVSGGTLLLRAPQTGDGGKSAVTTDDNGNLVTVGNGGDVGNDVAIAPIEATVTGARAITVEAFLPYEISNPAKNALIGTRVRSRTSG